MRFLPQKAVKGQAVADFLAKHPDPKATKLHEDLPDEVAEVCLTQMSFEWQVWRLFFDGVSRSGPQGNVVAGVGVALVSRQYYVIDRGKTAHTELAGSHLMSSASVTSSF